MADPTPTHPSYILLRDLLIDESRYLAQIAVEAQEAEHKSTLFVCCTDPTTTVEDARALYRHCVTHPVGCTGICCTGTKEELAQNIGGFETTPTEEQILQKRNEVAQEAERCCCRRDDKASWLSSLSAQKMQMETKYTQELQVAAQNNVATPPLNE